MNHATLQIPDSRDLALGPKMDWATDRSGPHSILGKTLVMMATYNEIENAPRLIDAIFSQVPEADVLVVDDNSPDGTGKWCDEQAAVDSRIHCLHRTGKLGLGTAIVAGLRYAVDHDYDYVLNLDADFSHHPRYIRQILTTMENPAERVDVVIGSRYVPGGGTLNWPLKRRLMSFGVNFYARCLLGLSVKDCSGGFRCYRCSLLRKLDWEQIQSRGYSFQEEILWRLKKFGGRFAETPIVFADREKGQSKIDSREAFAALYLLFCFGLQHWRDWWLSTISAKRLFLNLQGLLRFPKS